MTTATATINIRLLPQVPTLTIPEHFTADERVRAIDSLLSKVPEIRVRIADIDMVTVTFEVLAEVV